MAIPTFVAMGAGYAGTSDFNIPEPAGSLENDLYVAVTQVQSNVSPLDGGELTLPAGWSEPTPNHFTMTHVDTFGGFLSYIRRGASPALGFVLPVSMNHVIGANYGFRGTSSTNPFIFAGWQEHASRVSPAVTYVVDSFDTVSDDALACVGVHHPDNPAAGAVSVVGATCGAFTSRGSYISTWGSDGTVELWTCDMATAGPTGAITVTRNDSATDRLITVTSAFSIESAEAPSTWTVALDIGEGPLSALAAIADAKNGSHTATDFLGLLNEIAGTSNKDAVACLNTMGATSKEVIGALNDLAGTSGKDLLGAIKAWGEAGGSL
jgi:hypothetical protein